MELEYAAHKKEIFEDRVPPLPLGAAQGFNRSLRSAESETA